jgi:hypothetical protein
MGAEFSGLNIDGSQFNLGNVNNELQQSQLVAPIITILIINNSFINDKTVVNIKFDIEYFGPDPNFSSEAEQKTLHYQTISKSLSLLNNSSSIILYVGDLWSLPNNDETVRSIKIRYDFILDNAYKFTYFNSSIGTPNINQTNLISINDPEYINAPLYRPYGIDVDIYQPQNIIINLTFDFNLRNAAILPTLDIIVPTNDQILTETVIKNPFTIVEAGLSLCRIEELQRRRLYEILNNIETLRDYSRDTGSSTTYNNNGSLNQAGSRYTENFPSAKFANSVSINELLLNKKNYMFSNSLNKNVISGPVLYTKTSSSGLTKAQQFANAARGRTPSGGIGRRLGVQYYDGRNLVSSSNIYNQTGQTSQNINICNL